MNEIFISYATQDRERARMLAAALGKRGWDIWWDREIPLGKSFDEVIEKPSLKPSASSCFGPPVL